MPIIEILSKHAVKTVYEGIHIVQLLKVSEALWKISVDFTVKLLATSCQSIYCYFYRRP